MSMKDVRMALGYAAVAGVIVGALILSGIVEAATNTALAWIAGGLAAWLLRQASA
jgi:hypothetical protein